MSALAADWIPTPPFCHSCALLCVLQLALLLALLLALRLCRLTCALCTCSDGEAAVLTGPWKGWASNI